ncbi:hypothetical protein [Phenylobacterium sp.]|uniref:hypothetical protein n=1 Tax=Phenylobacterium sp. TaxID=1871053 RepID=UPI002736E56E|nr:hypothetical protein [Phenylobacterium sp.]MDP3635272.1 hypothetical protein [Phenylobacterium sp.]
MARIEEALDLEIAQLESELAADPRHIKLRLLKEARALYTPAPRHQSEDVSTAAPAVRARGTTPRADAGRLEILNAAERLLEGHTSPRKTAAIYTDLVARGYVIGGKEPKSNLSAMMYNSGRFQSHQRMGWTLKAKPSQEPEAATSDGFSQEEGV